MTRWTRWILACVVAVFGLLQGSVRAEPKYIQRNNNEYYWPYLVDDNFSFLSPAVDRLMRDEYARRYVTNLFGESRVNRPYFVDVGVEGFYGIDMPGQPYLGIRPAQEGSANDPRNAAVRAEVYGAGHVGKQWEIAVDVATRAQLIATEIPAEFYGRFMMIHHGFAGVNPLKAGFLVGPEIRPMDAPVGGFSVGGFGLLSQSRQTWTQARAQITWWGEADPFANLFQLELVQHISLQSRRLHLRIGGEAELRQVRETQYISLFTAEPPRSRYVDLALEASALTVLPAKFRLHLSGRFLPFHSPDPYIVRWYRPVYPELSVALQRKVAIFDFSLGYTFGWVPPKYLLDESYVDSGTGVIPDSSPAHLLNLTLNIRI